MRNTHSSPSSISTASSSSSDYDPNLPLKVSKWITAYELIRSGCLVALTGLSIDAIFITRDRRNVSLLVTGLIGAGKKTEVEKMKLFEIILSVFYGLATMMSISAALIRRDTGPRRTITFLLTSLLLIPFVIYTYRDIYPIITFSRHPLDPDFVPPAIAWTRFSLLFIASVLIPLFSPRQYRPVDALKPSSEPNPEQTASLFSYMFYVFVDPVIYKAWKSKTISFDALPPLADYDAADHLAKQSLLKLHPIRRQELGLKKRHLFICIMSVYWKVYMVLALMVVIRAVMQFASPIGIKQLLQYLQGGEQNDTDIKPWFWILWLFLGPTASSLAWQYYVFLTTRSLVHVESLFTQLLFEHALRIKMQDPTTGSSTGATPADGLVTPAVISEGEGEVAVAGHTENTAVEIRPLVNGDGDSSDGDVASNKREGSVASSRSRSKDGKKAAAAVKKEKEKADEKKNTASVVGRLTTLASADVDNIVAGRDILMAVLYAPLQLILGGVFLYNILSWSAIVGMAATAVTLPVPGYLAGLMNMTQRDLMKATDNRIQTITEAVNTLRMVKLFAWESKIAARIAEKRDIELKSIRRKALVNVAVSSVNFMLPIFSLAVTFALYSGVQKKVLTAAQIFSSLTVFEMIRGQMYTLTRQITATIQAKISIERFHEFLIGTELLDAYKEESAVSVAAIPVEGKTYFKNAEFVWEKPEKGSKLATGQRDFRLKIDDLEFPEGQCTIVAGKTGSGKSSLLLALLGEMNWAPTKLDASFNLPRAGGVAYCSQEAWVMADTVRNNIIFGEEFNEARYKDVIHQCALEKDLELFDAGDQTELGEKGLNASGGQKARISLARAVYSDASIILADSILEALDSTTSRWIVDKLFGGDLLKGRTVILVTHHVPLLAPVADYIVHMAVGGKIDHHGPIEDVAKLLPEDVSEGSSTDVEEPVSEAKPVDKAAPVEKKDDKDAGKLVIAEEKAEGKVSRKTLLNFFKAAGGLFFWNTYYFIVIVGEVLYALCNWWLGRWSQEYDVKDPRDVSVTFWLGMYVFLMWVQLMCYNTSNFFWTLGAIRASKNLHASLVHHILHAPLRFLDQTPTGRILSRFSKDFNSIDSNFVGLWQGISEIVLTLLMKAVILVYLVPLFGPIGFVLGVLGFGLAELYMLSQLSVKREMSNAKSPLYTAFNAAVNGVVSIRAYGAESIFNSQLRTRCDKYTRTATAFYNLNRWVTVRIDMLGGVFSAGLAALLFYGGSNLFAPAIVGFALNQAVSFSDILLYAVRIFNDFEIQANSIERINDYLVIDQEPAPTKQGTPPAAWPTSGDIVIKDLEARYFAGGPPVLNKLNLTIKSGDRVGIVGRTGSGKSSLTLALLRMIPTEGSIVIAGLDSKKVNLESLRSALSIIPQDPVLLSGTLRFNIDPFDEHDDYELNAALQSSGLDLGGQSDAAEDDDTALTLDTNITSGGGNLSAGQRQLVALARALVRGSKILVLDEATASVDHATDAMVQKAIRDLQGVTIITVAHRLSTIADYDKILVLGAGKLLEYDTPANLLKNQDGHFRALVNDSRDNEHLEALAEGRA